MQKNILAYVSIVCMYVLSSCTASKRIYTPATANVLQVEGKQDLQLAANYSAAGRAAPFESSEKESSSGIDIQSAYAISNKIAVKLDGYWKWESNQSIASDTFMVPDQKLRYQKRGVELSAGWYNFSKTKDRSTFQLFAGIGFGKFSFDETYRNGDPTDHHQMNYFKAFIQPDISIKCSKNYTLSFVSKLNLVTYSSIQTSFTNLDEPLTYIDKNPSVFLDLLMDHEFGFNKLSGIRFQLQYGLTALTTEVSSGKQTGFIQGKYEYNNVWAAIGVIADLRKLFTK